MSKTLDRVVSISVACAAIAIASSVVYATFIRTPPTPEPEPLYVKEWKQGLDVGRLVAGRADAPVQLIEFADLQCPVCGRFQKVLAAVVAARPNDVGLTYVSFPLNIHEFAIPAAQAAECAAEMGALGQWIDAVYKGQDSLGIKSWGTYAHEAGIADTAAIASCAKQESMPPRVAAGQALGDLIGVAGTPTTLINGWKYRGAATKIEIEHAIDSLTKGREPARKPLPGSGR